MPICLGHAGLPVVLSGLNESINPSRLPPRQDGCQREITLHHVRGLQTPATAGSMMRRPCCPMPTTAPDRGAFFVDARHAQSSSGDRPHLMKRFTGAGEAPERLDAILHDKLADLDAARTTEDLREVVPTSRASTICARGRHPLPSRLDTGGVRAAADAARPLAQSPDPSPRPGAHILTSSKRRPNSTCISRDWWKRERCA